MTAGATLHTTSGTGELQFVSDGKRLISTKADGSYVIWDVASGQTTERKVPVPSKPEESLLNMTVSPDGEILAGSGLGAGIYLWKTDTGESESLSQAARNEDGPGYVTFSGNGSFLAHSGISLTQTRSCVNLWDMRTRQKTATLLGENTPEAAAGQISPIRSLAVNADATVIAARNYHYILVWDATRPELKWAQSSPDSGDRPILALSPDGKMLAYTASSTSIQVSSVQTQLYVGLPLSHAPHSVTAAEFSPADDLLAVGDDAHTIRLWNTQSGKQIGQPLSGHSDVVTSLAFSPDGKVLASASADATVRLWELG
ncbi:WD40 repeat domain-containing protein [Nocardia sp. NPDC004722]